MFSNENDVSTSPTFGFADILWSCDPFGDIKAKPRQHIQNMKYINIPPNSSSSLAFATRKSIEVPGRLLLIAFLLFGLHSQTNAQTNIAPGESVIVGGDYNAISTTNCGFIGGGTENSVAAENAGIVAGFDNAIESTGSFGFLGGGAQNFLSGQDNTIVGGVANAITNASYAGIIGGTYDYISGDNSFIGGGDENSIGGGSGTIVGGYENTISNASDVGIVAGSYNSIDSGSYSFIGGGSVNSITAAGFAATVGGWSNAVSGESSGIIGGVQNSIAGYYAVIAGGYSNSIESGGSAGAIFGGVDNSIYQSDNCFIPGGYSNVIGGISGPLISNSVVGGLWGTVTNNNTFMWNDGSGTGLPSSKDDNQFIVNASGGIYLNGTLISGGSIVSGVTSVSMTGDGTLFNSTVSGSPITGTGTLAPSLKNQNANTVFAGPASGGAAAPTFQTAPTFSGANLTDLNASSLANGTIPYTQLPSGVITNNNAAAVFVGPDSYFAVPGSSGGNNYLYPGGVTIESGGLFVGSSPSSLDSGQISTDGAGDLAINEYLTVTGYGTILDDGAISTDGSGDLTVVSISGNGTGLTDVAGCNIVESVYKSATGFTLTPTNSVVLINGSSQTVTLPSAVGNSGKTYTIKLIANSSATVATTSSQNIDGSTSFVLTAQYKYVKLVSDGTQWWNIANN